MNARLTDQTHTAANWFRINTYKSVSKQTTSLPLESTLMKNRGRGEARFIHPLVPPRPQRRPSPAPLYLLNFLYLLYLQSLAASWTLLGSLFRPPFLCFQCLAASFSKTPGGEVGQMCQLPIRDFFTEGCRGAARRRTPRGRARSPVLSRPAKIGISQLVPR